jgi:hypothetical protein
LEVDTHSRLGTICDELRLRLPPSFSLAFQDRQLHENLLVWQIGIAADEEIPLVALPGPPTGEPVFDSDMIVVLEDCTKDSFFPVPSRSVKDVIGAQELARYYTAAVQPGEAQPIPDYSIYLAVETIKNTYAKAIKAEQQATIEIFEIALVELESYHQPNWIDTLETMDSNDGENMEDALYNSWLSCISKMYDAYQKLRLTQEFIVFPRKDH